MGINTNIYLPHDVRVRDVAEVIGILAGLEVTKSPLHNGCEEPWGIRVSGATIKGNENVPQICDIVLKGELIDGEKEHFAYYHFEVSGFQPPNEKRKYSRMVSQRMSPFWIAVGIKLAMFFGGAVDFNDSDDNDFDMVFGKPRKWNDEEDGEPWQNFQREMFELKPVTKEDLEEAKKFASY